MSSYFPVNSQKITDLFLSGTFIDVILLDAILLLPITSSKPNIDGITQGQGHYLITWKWLISITIQKQMQKSNTV